METIEPHTAASPPESVAIEKNASRRYSYRRIWLIAYPILLSSLVEQLVGMTDTAFLGRVGEIELGASALGGIFFIAVFMLILGFCAGAQILMGRRNGEKNYADIGTVFYHSLGFLFLLSVVLLLLTRWFAPPLLRAIISSNEVCEAAWKYLDWRMWGIFFSMVACLFRSFYVATTRTGVLKFNSLVMVGSNIVLDYLLIFGHFGFPEMGIAGAAVASAMASFFSMSFFIVYTWWKGDYRKYALNRLPKFKLRLLGKMLNVSMWMMVQHFLSLFTWFLFFIAIEHLGTRELAVTNVLRSISGFTYMSLHAFASTASTLTSNLIGAGERNLVLPMLKRDILLASILLVPTWLLISLFPETVLSIFTNDAALIAAGVAPLWMLGLSYVFQIPSLVLFYSVSGTGNTRTALAIEVFALVVYSIYVYYAIFRFRCSLAVAWSSEFLYSFPILVLAFVYMRWGKWHRKTI
ncbi:MATE family efflux transporter [Alloprevotella sp. OH1205_COT-284]|uniref:MATE family efflux transporter n=1 Tax=Alloprevotella sp. OH1205_COT-284 TaxID=2491043 RepID=UPI000F5EFFE9|nr:MATE family efflux transporter [Alloprevotella sp. OH1205_COT-284]RRD80355.1 MATE family efflux transporter [Alloprevotella sp. OH1205_COT-284]